MEESVIPRTKRKIAPYKSGYEFDQAQRLIEAGINFEYEPHEIEYWQTINNGVCWQCNSNDVAMKRVYTPDFWFPKSKIYVETKGKLDQPSRRKMIAIYENQPRDIRMVFQRDNYLTRKKSMLYSRWAELNNITYAVGDIPLEWIQKDKT